MIQYHKKDLHLVTDSFVFDNLDERDPSIEAFWYKITEDEVVYNFRNHKDVKCLVLNSNGFAEQKVTSLTGKLSVPLIRCDTLDFSKAIDEIICALSVVQFKENFSSFKQIVRSDIQSWVSSCECGGAFYTNQKTKESLSADNVFIASLPDDIVTFIPSDKCAGIIPYKLDNDRNLITFGASVFVGCSSSVEFIDDSKGKI